MIKGSTDAKEEKKVVHWRKVEGRVIAKSVFRTAIRQKYLVTEVLSDFSESFSAPLKAIKAKNNRQKTDHLEVEEAHYKKTVIKLHYVGFVRHTQTQGIRYHLC